MRLFIAMTLPPPVRDALGACQAELQRTIGRRVRWTAASQLHITLRFLGAADASLVPALLALIRRCAAGVPSIEAAWSPVLGAFPSVGAPRVLWAGLGAGAEAVCSVARQIEAGVIALGCPPEEHAFHPHVTLGRVRAPAEAAEVSRHLHAITTPLDSAPFRLETLALIESALKPEGPIHTTLGTASLGT